MLGFRASYASGDIILQEDELADADFFDLSNLPRIPPKGSIARDLIDQVAQRAKYRFITVLIYKQSIRL